MADEPVKYGKVYYIKTALTEKFPIIPYRTVGMIDTDDAIYCMCQVTSATGNYEIYKLDIPSDGLTPIHNTTLTWKSAAVLSYSDYGYIYHYQKPNYYRMNDKDGEYKCFIVTGNKLYFSDNPIGPFTKVSCSFLTSTAPSNVVYAYSKYCIIYQYRLYSSVDGIIWEIANPNLYDMTNYQGLFMLNNQLVAAVVGTEYSYVLIETTGALPGKWKEYKYLTETTEGEYSGQYIESVNDLLLNEVCGEDIIVISKSSNDYFSWQFSPLNFKDGMPTSKTGANFSSTYVTDADNGFSLIHSSQSYKNEYYLCSESKLNDTKPSLPIYSKLDAYREFTGVSTDTSSSSNNLYSFQLDTPTGFHVSKNCDYVISYPTDSSEYVKEKRVIGVDPYIFVAGTNDKGFYYSTDGKLWNQSNITDASSSQLLYANGILVMGTYETGIYYSTDGKSWTQSNINNISIHRIYNANDIWVACSWTEGIYYSTDGKVWNQSNITGESYYNIHNANGIWVTGNDDGNNKGLYYSTDGKTWNQSNITNKDFDYVGYGNGIWVASNNSGGTGSLYYSTDGKTWNQSNITNKYFGYTVYVNGIWLAGDATNVGDVRYGIYYSTDGKVWNQSNITNINIDYIGYANGIWVACNNNNNGLYYSTNGKSWTHSNITSGSFMQVYNANGIWVAADYNNGLYYSTDGKEWTQSNITSGWFYDVFNANGIWVAGNNKGVNYYSTDGKVWTQSNITSSRFNTMYSTVNIIVSGTDKKGLYYSADGKSWNQSNITNGSFDFTSIYNANGIWVACSYNYGLYYSTDGKVWNQSNITSGYFYTIYNANGIWVAGTSYNDGGGLYYSADGKSWDQSNITNGSFFTVYNANGIWVAGSYNDKGLYYSTDGKSWSQSNITSGYFYTAYNANGIWVAGSMNDNGLYYSTDGKTWSKSNITSGRFPSIYNANGIWVASYGYSGLCYSTDGKSWTKSNMTSGNFKSVYNANGIWVAGSATGSVNPGLYYSTDGKTWSKSNITSGRFPSIYNANGIWLANGDDAIYYSTDGKVWYEADTSGFIISKNPNAMYKSCLIESDADVEIYKYNSANRDLLGEVTRISLRENGDILNNYKPEKTLTYSGTKYELDKTELYGDDLFVNGSYTLRLWYKQVSDNPSEPSTGGDDNDKDKTIYNSAFYHF